MTVPQLKQLASDNGYALTSTNKAGIISEILVQQGQVILDERRAYKRFGKLSDR